MEYEYLLKRRKYQDKAEPLINYLYRLSGFLLTMVLSAGALSSFVLASIFPISFVQILRGALFSLVVFCTGIAASEVWYRDTSLRWYVPGAPLFKQKHLAIAISGLFASAALLVFLVLQL